MDKILRDKKAIFVFIAPALIMFLLVLIIPTIQMVYYSLCDYAALTPPEFVGLKNYKKLFFGDATFRIALKKLHLFHDLFSSHTADLRSFTCCYAHQHPERPQHFQEHLLSSMRTFLRSTWTSLVFPFQSENRYQQSSCQIRH